MVCIAVFHASAASTLPGKMLGLWMPIAAFVAIGLEHSGESVRRPVSGAQYMRSPTLAPAPAHAPVPVIDLLLLSPAAVPPC